MQQGMSNEDARTISTTRRTHLRFIGNRPDDSALHFSPSHRCSRVVSVVKRVMAGEHNDANIFSRGSGLLLG